MVMNLMVENAEKIHGMHGTGNWYKSYGDKFYPQDPWGVLLAY